MIPALRRRYNEAFTRDLYEGYQERLAAECGATITMRATGEDSEAALDALCAVIANKFGES